MKDLKVNITPALVTANFSTMKSYLEVEVARYEVEVAEHTVKDAKKLATELNAVTKAINSVKKEQLLILEAPVKLFKSQIAELNEIVQSGRIKILKQVQVYEEITLQRINDFIVEKEFEEYNIQDLGEEYHGIDFSDLVLLGSITKTGNLTKKVIDEIIARVSKAKSIERAVEIRLLQLENECYKAGLKSPLSPEYIKEFLRAEDSVYKERLERLIKIEIGRQSHAEAELQTLKDEAKVVEKAVEAIKDPTPIAEAPEGKKTLRIAISFDIIVRENAPENKVLQKMRELLENAGIPKLNQIKIEG